MTHVSWPELYRRTRDISDEEAERLEAVLVANPDDLDTRVRLIGYSYMNRKASSARRHAHIHWLITNHPEVDVGPMCVIDDASSEAYEEGKRRWLAVIDARHDEPAVLKTASEFFRDGDPAVAESLVRRGMALEPASPAWPKSLALLQRVARETRPPTTTAGGMRAMRSPRTRRRSR